MWMFFKQKEWRLWAYGGTALILTLIYATVHFDVQINYWFRDFYDQLQKALSSPGEVTEKDFILLTLSFAYLAGMWMVLTVITQYVASHFVFRWRTSMTSYYETHFDKLYKIEGSSQRIQEDTLKFARIVEDLGQKLIESLLLMASFVPILWVLSKEVTELPYIGPVDHSLVIVALVTSLVGTAILIGTGIKLPGIEYDIQKKEAAYRKELVLAEDSGAPRGLAELYGEVRQIHYKSYFHYLYFNTVKWSYLQGMVIVPYIVLAPTIVSGIITLGFVNQALRAFGRVAESLQYLIRSWNIVVELLSVYKRLKEFEKTI